MTASPVDLTADRLACKVCKGSGLSHHEAFSFEGKNYPARDYPCNACQGFGWFTPPSFDDILKRIVATKGKNKGTVRASFTSPTIVRDPSEEQRREQINAKRAYYVWRLARFHGGKDTTMPSVAMLFSRGDPYIQLLDALADGVARKAFGTSMGAAAMWGKALLGSNYTGPDPIDLMLR